MGTCLSSEEKKSRLRSYLIDQRIEEDRIRFKKEYKILLLGSGESGISTIVKQMKICQNGYTKDELAQYRITVYKNLVDSAQDFVYAMKKLRLEPRKLVNKIFSEKIFDYYVESEPSFQLSPEIVEAIDSLWHDPIISEVMEKQDHFYLTESAPYFFAEVRRIGAPGYIPNEADVLQARTKTRGILETRFDMGQMSIRYKLRLEPRKLVNKIFSEKIFDYYVESEPSFQLSPEIVEAIDSLWHDPIISEVMEKQDHFYLTESAPYFFAEVRRIGAPGYIPNEADVLQARTKTRGILETRFDMGQMSIRMIDVSGQRTERKKWIHCFESVTSILFCVALSEYDQALLEESSQNRLAYSLLSFEIIINSRWFLRTSIILFLTKIYSFRVKLSRAPLEQYFPDYSGGSDINKAAKYILWRFTQTNRARLNIFPHLVDETATSNANFCCHKGNNLAECCQL
ncbi:hypothetical protein Glove_132g100 [Diversispora epigaea]|uniref:G protein alpha subunit n=1 Tax=Diversispora epigaea TaxID=1348612 RepID=A0A397IXK2_9GLOM|nr:hypothetical protein Glove_132g100 [Diversispora epigaea]